MTFSCAKSLGSGLWQVREPLREVLYSIEETAQKIETYLVNWWRRTFSRKKELEE